MTATYTPDMILEKWGRLKRGDQVIVNAVWHDAACDYFKEHDGPDADLFFRSLATWPNPVGVGTLDTHIASLKLPCDAIKSTFGMCFTSKQLAALMRRHKVTIRELSKRVGYGLDRVRFRRKHGFKTCEMDAARDWIQAITGKDPGERLEAIA